MRMLVILIGLGVLLSVSLGIYLRSRDGDLVWVSVIHAGEGGAVQTALLTLSSAGSGSHRIELGSEYALVDDEDILQLTRHSDEFRGIEYQGELTAPSPRGGTEVDIAPLGSRRIHARGPIANVKPLEIDASASRNDRTGISQLQISITNPNPFDILSPQLIINRPDRDLNVSVVLRKIPAGQTIGGEFPMVNRRDSQSMQYGISTHFMPKSSKEPSAGYAPALNLIMDGSDQLIVVGKLAESPEFKVSGDFVEHVGGHYFLQKLPIELPNRFGF